MAPLAQTALMVPSQKRSSTDDRSPDEGRQGAAAGSISDWEQGPDASRRTVQTPW